MNYLIVVDMQNDFIDGALGTKEARAIVPRVVEKIKNFEENGGKVLFTRDTHDENYLNTQEGKNLPVAHCIKGSQGFELAEEIKPYCKGKIFDKPTFGSIELGQYLAEQGDAKEITLVGLCTDICVISNALSLKAALWETPIGVRPSCCAGVTPESHNNALSALQMCQIDLLGDEK